MASKSPQVGKAIEQAHLPSSAGAFIADELFETRKLTPFVETRAEWDRRMAEADTTYRAEVQELKARMDMLNMQLMQITHAWTEGVTGLANDVPKSTSVSFLSKQAGAAHQWMDLVDRSMPHFTTYDLVTGSDLDELIAAWSQSTGKGLLTPEQEAPDNLTAEQIDLLPAIKTSKDRFEPLLDPRWVAKLLQSISALRVRRASIVELTKRYNALGATQATQNPDAEKHIEKAQMHLELLRERMNLVGLLQEVWFIFNLGKTNVLNRIANTNLLAIETNLKELQTRNPKEKQSALESEMELTRQTLLALKELHVSEVNLARKRLLDAQFEFEQLERDTAEHSQKLTSKLAKYNSKVSAAVGDLVENAPFPAWKLNLHFDYDLAEMDVFQFDGTGTKFNPLTEASGGSKCHAVKRTLMPHQQIRGELLSPRYKDYPGFAVLDEPGMGKTRGVAAGMQRWLEEAGFERASSKFPDHVSDRHVLVLVPSEKLLNNWITELRLAFPPETHKLDMQEISDATAKNTVILTLTQKQTATMRAITEPLTIVVHSFAVQLPTVVQNMYKKLRPTAKRDMPTVTYRSSGGVYDILQHGMIEDQAILNMLEKDRIDTERKVSAILGCMVPGHGFVVVDEAHLLVYPKGVGNHAGSSYTCLRWIKEIREALHIKKNLLTATPSFKNPMDTIRLLNIFHDPSDKQYPGGVYRRLLLQSELEDCSRPRSTPCLGKAYAVAQELEEQYLYNRLKEDVRSSNVREARKWSSEKRLELQQYYTGDVARADFTSDPGLFAQPDRDGLTMHAPSNKPWNSYFVRDKATNRYKLLEKSGSSPIAPGSARKGWTWMYVPPSPATVQGKGKLAKQVPGVEEVFAPVENDDDDDEPMPSQGKVWKHVQSVELLVPLHADRFKDYRKKYLDDVDKHKELDLEAREQCVRDGKCIDFGDNANESAVQRTWWIDGKQDKSGVWAPPPKLQAVAILLHDRPREKFAIFSNVEQFQYVRNAFTSFAKHISYEFWDLTRFANWMMDMRKAGKLQVADVTKDQLASSIAKVWIDEQDRLAQKLPSLRNMFYIGKVLAHTEFFQSKRAALEQVHPSMNDKRIQELMFEIWNSASNYFGEVAHVLVNDKWLKLGFSLLDTANLVLMEPPANQSLEKQLAKRITRMCGIRSTANTSEWKFRVITLVSTLPFLPSGADAKAAEDSVQLTSEEFQFQRLRNREDEDLAEYIQRALYDVAIDRVLLARATGNDALLERDQPIAYSPTHNNVVAFEQAPIPALGRIPMCITDSQDGSETDPALRETAVEAAGLRIEFGKAMNGHHIRVVEPKNQTLKELNKMCIASNGRWQVGQPMNTIQAIAHQWLHPDTRDSFTLQADRYAEFLHTVARARDDGLTVEDMLVPEPTITDMFHKSRDAQHHPSSFDPNVVHDRLKLPNRADAFLPQTDLPNPNAVEVVRAAAASGLSTPRAPRTSPKTSMPGTPMSISSAPVSPMSSFANPMATAAATTNTPASNGALAGLTTGIAAFLSGLGSGSMMSNPAHSPLGMRPSPPVTPRTPVLEIPILPKPITTSAEDWELFTMVLKLVTGEALSVADLLVTVQRLTETQRDVLRRFLDKKFDALTPELQNHLLRLAKDAVKMFELQVGLSESRIHTMQALQIVPDSKRQLKQAAATAAKRVEEASFQIQQHASLHSDSDDETELPPVPLSPTRSQRPSPPPQKVPIKAAVAKQQQQQEEEEVAPVRSSTRKRTTTRVSKPSTRMQSRTEFL